MLYCLMDGRARTSTELAVVAEVSPSTASVHLQRLTSQRLVKVLAQGKHRYYSLGGVSVAAALEALNVLAGGSREAFVPNTPNGLRAARTCYDHIAGTVGVLLHDRFQALGWTVAGSNNACDLTPSGTKAVEALGIDVQAARALRRRFAYPCLDWSERRPHLGWRLGRGHFANRAEEEMDAAGSRQPGPARYKFWPTGNEVTIRPSDLMASISTASLTLGAIPIRIITESWTGSPLPPDGYSPRSRAWLTA